VGIFVSDNNGLIYPLSVIINKTKCPAKSYLLKTENYTCRNKQPKKESLHQKKALSQN